ncbi:uroporphyrinogen-III synthase [Nitratifractor salsuginis]|uniref:Uroporphyrinogen-III synthase n=1 Tax=Nitratifractor salsuginis (strain DSM 16511 / JCM 12458 / E9I37-1) TaxID=749222 RepID=E6X0D7_NITSE|nr:uroporphyrinogen-III synthase [Nitratifractor salsuginis]ADV45726.1 Uroporphyrinogen III synthase HEM4 [Nitratifractor salsuginis DSM 16511]
MNPRIYLTSPVEYPGTIPLPMIRFALVADRIDYQGCDTLMFTSKQAVLSAEAIDPDWKRLPAIAIGPATQRQIETLGGEVLFRPDSFYGESLAQEVVKRFRERKLLYLRPKKVSFDSRGYLERMGITLKDQILYETRCRDYTPEEAPEPGSVIVFTSPSTIHCFLENFAWRDDYHAVVIGRSTLAHLPEGPSFSVAEEPTIAACIARARQWAEILPDTK